MKVLLSHGFNLSRVRAESTIPFIILVCLPITLFVLALFIGIVFETSSLFFPRAGVGLQPVAFVAAGLPSFLALSYLMLGFLAKARVRKRATADISRIIPLSNRLATVAGRVRTQTGLENQVKFVIGLNSRSVYLNRKRIVVGDWILERALDEELEGMLAHELAHSKHTWKRSLLSVLLLEILVIQLIVILFPHVFIFLGILFALLSLTAIPVRWKMEYDADKKAAGWVGAERVIMGLKRLARVSTVGISLTHPALSRRIERLEILR